MLLPYLILFSIKHHLLLVSNKPRILRWELDALIMWSKGNGVILREKDVCKEIIFRTTFVQQDITRSKVPESSQGQIIVPTLSSLVSPFVLWVPLKLACWHFQLPRNNKNNDMQLISLFYFYELQSTSYAPIRSSTFKMRFYSDNSFHHSQLPLSILFSLIRQSCGHSLWLSMSDLNEQRLQGWLTNQRKQMSQFNGGVENSGVRWNDCRSNFTSLGINSPTIFP